MNKYINFSVNKAEELMEKYPGVMNNPEGFVKHIRGVANIALETTREMLGFYKNLPLSLEEMTIAGGSHDFGRPLNPRELGQLGHEMSSANYLESEGESWKILNYSRKDSYRVAQMVRTHSSIYEQWKVAFEKNDPRTKSLLKHFGNLNEFLLIPRTWQEAIITYSDLCDKNEERVDPVWKIKDAMERYKNNLQIADAVVVIAHERAMERLTSMCENIESARKGRLKEEEIRSLFGFL